MKKFIYTGFAFLLTFVLCALYGIDEAEATLRRIIKYLDGLAPGSFEIPEHLKQ